MENRIELCCHTKMSRLQGINNTKEYIEEAMNRGYKSIAITDTDSTQADYNIINSRAIADYCRSIKHQFNTEELAVLIFRNKRMSIEEKIKKYNDLIENYSDMEVIERINCKHYDSVKDMIKGEIQRLQELEQEIKRQDENMLYTYSILYKCSRGFEECNNFYKTYDEVQNAINKELQEDEDNEMLMYRVIKRSFIRDEKQILETYVIDDKRNSKVIGINNTEEYLDIDNICLNIPTPFKKGDILVSYSSSPFNYGTTFTNGKYPFVLDWLITWREGFQKYLDKGNCDSSDMQGLGYYISEYNDITYDNNYDYDCWEYFDGKLEGNQRILKGISSLMKNEIGIELFLQAYEYIKADENNKNLSLFSKEGLQLTGLNEEDVRKIY